MVNGISSMPSTLVLGHLALFVERKLKFDVFRRKGFATEFDLWIDEEIQW